MRNVDTAMQAELPAPVIEPVIFLMLTFRSMTCYVCSAGYDIAWNGQTYTGLGTLAGISAIAERSEVKADGLTLTLSGIDPRIMSECIADIQPLAPAKVWFGLINQGQVVGNPYCIFSGLVDKPSIGFPTAESATISLALESRIALLNRASQRRYTAADQHAFGHPQDTGFNSVEKLQDISLRVGV